MANSSDSQNSQPRLLSFLFGDHRLAVVWLVIRLYVGWQWLVAGFEKSQSAAWTGNAAGTAIQGFVKGALAKTGGAHPDVSLWYAEFLKNFVLPNSTIFSYLVTYGEIAVGIGLILGAFTPVAAFFGAFMNMNYLLAGTLSTNPVLLLLQFLLLLAWRTAGYFGLDRFLPSLLKKSRH